MGAGALLSTSAHFSPLPEAVVLGFLEDTVLVVAINKCGGQGDQEVPRIGRRVPEGAAL